MSSANAPELFEGTTDLGLTWIISHEVAETTASQSPEGSNINIADPCEHSATTELPFLGTLISEYIPSNETFSGSTVPATSGGQVCANNANVSWATGNQMCNDANNPTNAPVDCACFCEPTDAPAIGNPIVNFCGAGGDMVLQARLDQLHSRNLPPWDLPSAANGYQGSLYLSVNVNGRWTAGGNHEAGFPNPVATPAIKWGLDESDLAFEYVEVDGFGQGYTGEITGAGAPGYFVQPGETIFLSAYDTAWGQLNSLPGPPPIAPAGSAEPPFQFSLPVQVAQTGFSDYGGWTISGPVVGDPNCGATLGHTVGPLPIANANVSIAPAPGDTVVAANVMTSDPDGIYSFSYTPMSEGQKTVTLTATYNGKTAPVTIDVPPRIEQLTVWPTNSAAKPVGPFALVQGGQTAMITGLGLGGSPTVMIPNNRPGLPPFSVGAQPMGPGCDGRRPGTCLTFPTPNSIADLSFPAPGIATAEVRVVNNNVRSEPVALHFVAPDQPYLTFSTLPNTSPTCSPEENLLVTATVLDGQGNLAIGFCNPVTKACLRPITLAPATSGVSLAPWTSDEASIPPPGTLLIPNPGTVVASFFVTTPPQEIEATFTDPGGNATSSTMPIPPNALNQLPEGACVFRSNGNPTPNGGHERAAFYTLQGSSFTNSIWHRPVLGDPWDWAEPTVESLGSETYPPSSFTIKSLGVDDLWALGSYVSPSGYAPVAIPFTRPVDPPGVGPNLCFTGRAVQISLAQPEDTPQWNAVISYPVEQGVPIGQFRVFGLNKSSAIWVEMPIRTVQTASGPTVVAGAATVDPQGVVSGTVDGPYVLAYWSDLPCLGTLPTPLELATPCGENTTDCLPPSGIVSCVTARTDAANCGGCGNACPAGDVCTAGKCVASTNCPHGLVACGNPETCVDPLTNSSFCSSSGTCGSACPSEEGCAGGKCVASVALTNGAGPLYCQGGYAPLTVVQGNGASDCTGNLTQQASAGGVICDCAGATLSQTVTTDSFNSLNGPYLPGGLSAPVLVNGSLVGSNVLTIGGNLDVGGALTLSSRGNLAEQNLFVGGALTVSGSLSVAQDAVVYGPITGNVTVGGTLSDAGGFPSGSSSGGIEFRQLVRRYLHAAGRGLPHLRHVLHRARLHLRLSRRAERQLPPAAAARLRSHPWRLHLRFR